MKDGFIKVAAGTPKIRVADCKFNKDSVLQLIEQAQLAGVKLLTLPELCISGYTCGDLFLQSTLLQGAEAALTEILSATAETDMLFALGLPVKFGGKLYNCAAVCSRGQLLGLVPKTCLPNYGEFYECRWFSPAMEEPQPVIFAGQATQIGAKQLFCCADMDGLSVGIEICEDLWAICPPSCGLVSAGATVILNLSASNEVAAKDAYRRSLVEGQSARLICGYVYADAGEGESTTDLVFAGHDMIAENGVLLAQRRYGTGLVSSELDVDYISHERRRISTFPPAQSAGYKIVPFDLHPCETVLTRKISPSPFVPEDSELRMSRCRDILQIAALGLKKRMEHTHSEKLVLGVSGGLDSTLAMLISARALEMLSMPGENLIAVTMPCFGTTRRTRSNAEKLSKQLGASLKTVSIAKSVRQHFADIGHDENTLDVVFENAQARERTQVLMDIANGCNALVVGTGDMSELALGWATYNGDHMSMYGVNGGIPKTLVRYLVEYCAKTTDNKQLSAVLRDVLDTPVSPELLPAENGSISQKTEELVGPYELHDFFLYQLIRRGCEPEKVLRLAEYAFAGTYDRQTILSWLKTFIRRFFAQQFKRSCLPDGPKVGSLSLSPRGDWRMPSDGVADLWLERLEKLSR